MLKPTECSKEAHTVSPADTWRLLIIAVASLVVMLQAAAEQPRFVELVDNVVGAPNLEFQSIVPSADGRHLYAAGLQYNFGAAVGGLSLWDLDDSGLPSFRHAWSASELGLEAQTIRVQVLSPDDRHLYVAGRASGEDAATELVVLERRTDGSLDLVQRLVAANEHHPDGVSGLDHARHLASSPDGRHLYASGSTGIVTLARDTGDGRLTAIQKLPTAAAGLLVAADGSAVWTSGSELTTHVRDPATGMLTQHSSQLIQVAGGVESSNGLWPLPGGGAATIGRNTSLIFGIEEFLIVFSPSPTGGPDLVPTSAWDVSGDGLSVLGVATSPVSDELFLSVAGDSGISIRSLRRDSSGQLATTGSHAFAWGTDGDLAVSADGTRLYGGLFDLRPLATFDVDDLDGAGLELLGPELSELPGVLGPRKVRVAPNGEHVFVAAYGSLTHFRRTATGLEEASRLQLELPANELGTDDVFDVLEISPNGRVLVTNIHDSLAVAALGPDDRLEWIDRDVSTLAGDPELAFSTDGRFFYASRHAFAVIGDRLEPLGFQVPSHPDAFTPGGTVAYAARGSASATSVLELDPETGAMELIGEIDGMSQPAVSPDGRHLYALRLGGHVDDPGPLQVRVYEIGNSPTDVRWIEEVVVLGPDSPDFTASEDSEILLDRAGRFLYVRPFGGHLFHVYRRDLGTGRLSFVEALDAGRHEALETALTGLRSIAVSPSGNDLYVASSSPLGGSVSLLRRPCLADDERNLCLQGARLRVEARWREFQGQVGDGRMRTGTGDSGLLWFFDEENWEVLVKVLDGCSLTDHFWVFAAATTNVEYTLDVTDTITGKSVTYTNPLGVNAPAITDTFALDICSAGTGAAAPDLGPPMADSDDTLALRDGRFELEVDWRDFTGRTGSGRVVDLRTDDSGIFYFFAGDNWEMLVKVLDGCGFNDRHWVFAAATTNVEYTLRVTDTQTGARRTYFNPLGRTSPAITDTAAFASCP